MWKMLYWISKDNKCSILVWKLTEHYEVCTIFLWNNAFRNKVIFEKTVWKQLMLVVTTNGCVRLASLGLARGAHSCEPLTRARRTITHPCSDVMHLGPATKWPTPHAGHWGLTRVSPWNDIKAIRTQRGKTGVDPWKLNKGTHCEGIENVRAKRVVFCLLPSDVEMKVNLAQWHVKECVGRWRQTMVKMKMREWVWWVC